MALLDDLRQPERFRARIGCVCTMCATIRDLTGPEQAAVNDLLNDSSIAATTIARILANNGKRVPADAVARHRRGDCVGSAD